MSIANGQHPENLNYSLLEMRRHLYNCFEDKVMRHFPAKQRMCHKRILKYEEVEVYCKCRLQEDGYMVECDACNEWYHPTCEKIDKDILEKQCSTWYCSSCSSC